MKSDIEIAQSAQMKPIDQIAADLGIAPEELEVYYRTMEKLCENFVAMSAALAGSEETQRAFYADTIIKETENEQQKA